MLSLFFVASDFFATKRTFVVNFLEKARPMRGNGGFNLRHPLLLGFEQFRLERIAPRRKTALHVEKSDVDLLFLARNFFRAKIKFGSLRVDFMLHGL